VCTPFFVDVFTVLYKTDIRKLTHSHLILIRFAEAVKQHCKTGPGRQTLKARVKTGDPMNAKQTTGLK